MIKLRHDPVFEQDVRIAVPGSTEPELVKFTFRTMDRQRVVELLIIAGMSDVGRLKRLLTFIRLCIRNRTYATAVDLLNELIVEWDGINVEYSKENLKSLLLEYPGARESIFFAYFAGLREAKTKN